MAAPSTSATAPVYCTLPERLAHVESRVDALEANQVRLDRDVQDFRGLIIKTLLTSIGGLLAATGSLLVMLLRK